MKLNLPVKFFLLSFFGVVVFSAFAVAQTQEWVARYNGAGNNTDEANVLYVDANGNSYVAGYTYGASLEENIVVIKYDSGGIQQWADTNRAANGFSYADAIAVDGAGNVFITGYSTNTTSNSYIVIKYNAAGVFQWQAFLGASGSLQDEGMAIATDANFVLCYRKSCCQRVSTLS